MVPLVVNDVSFSYGSRVVVLRDVRFTLEPGFHGLVGENGAGKSTLLALLAGELAPDEGVVRVTPGALVRVCRQGVERLDDDVRAFALASDAIAARLRGRLALHPAMLARWATLSPGERRRWQLAAALAADPDVLLLDEPTNHLDDAARDLLLDELSRFRGVGVVVSHDRALLERVPRSILRLRGGTVTVHPGAYAQARRDWTRADQERADERDARVAAARRAEERLDEARRKHEAARASQSTGRRMKDARDHDGRSALRKGMAAAGEARAGRVVAVRRHEAARARAAARAIVIERELGGRLSFRPAPSPSARSLAVDEDAIDVGGHVVMRDVHLAVGHTEHVRVAGANGAGKSTLLRRLVASARGGGVAYVAQELSLDEGSALLQRARLLPPAARGRVLSFVAALGVAPDRLLATDAPSPGEAKKLALALALGAESSAIVLDEPTNHLDLPSIERLETALAAFSGALVLVSHDDAFAHACTDATFTICDGRVERGDPESSPSSR